RKVSEHGIMQVLLQKDREVAEAYRVDSTPSAVLVRPDGTVGSPLAQGADAIRTLITQVVNRSALRMLPLAAPTNGRTGGDASSQPAHPGVGEPAPAFDLP